MKSDNESIQGIVKSKVINAMAKFNETIKTDVENSCAQVIKDRQNDATNNHDKGCSITRFQGNYEGFPGRTTYCRETAFRTCESEEKFKLIFGKS